MVLRADLPVKLQAHTGLKYTAGMLTCMLMPSGDDGGTGKAFGVPKAAIDG